MRKIVLLALGFAIIIGSIFVAKAIINSKNTIKPKAEKIVKTVFGETVKNGNIPIIIPANGTLVAKNRLELYAEVQGIFRFSAKDFKAGQEYRSGETLLNIDSQEYYASVQAAKSDFYNLIASLMPDLRLDYPEAFPIWQDYLSSIDINKPTPELPKIASENVNFFITGRGVLTRYYNVKNLEQRLAKYRISAPFNGILTEALVTKGTLVRQGQKLGEFIDPTVFEVELAIEKSFSDLLKEGEDVALTTLSLDKEYVGKVSRINGKIDQATQTIKVFVEVKGDDLKEGMYLSAQMDAREERDAIKIARKLLIDESQIFIIKDSVLDLLYVQPTYFTPKYVVIKGVPDGTQILAKPIPGAYVGMIVKVIDETSATPSENLDTD